MSSDPSHCRAETGKVYCRPSSNTHHGWGSGIFFFLMFVLGSASAWVFLVSSPTNPSGFDKTDLTLRKILQEAATTEDAGFHLALAPAFFGFYGYFGALAAWEEAVDSQVFQSNLERQRVYSVAGASAGAMAAVLLASGVSPRAAANFCSNVTLAQFADFPALGAAFRGDAFQNTMHNFVRSQRPHQSLLLEDAVLPVAVSGFDLQTFEGKILHRGSMARAARASATFPLLFQPVGWKSRENEKEDYTLIDGGIGDVNGWKGLAKFVHGHGKKSRQRVVHIQMATSLLAPSGPSDFLKATRAALESTGDKHLLQDDLEVEIVSISLSKLPQCGPWALEKGPVAVEAARQAMVAALDTPLLKRYGSEDHHYEIEIDTSSFW